MFAPSHGQSDGLPKCSHRGKPRILDGRFACDSPKLIPNPGWRSSEYCQQCPYHDLGPLHESRMPAPSNTAGNSLISCSFHGEDVVDEHGRAVTRECKTCGDKLRKQKVFRCTHPERNESVTIRDCVTCPYRLQPTLILFSTVQRIDSMR
jgi:hypothetical protein